MSERYRYPKDQDEAEAMFAAAMMARTRQPLGEDERTVLDPFDRDRAFEISNALTAKWEVQ